MRSSRSRRSSTCSAGRPVAPAMTAESNSAPWTLAIVLVQVQHRVGEDVSRRQQIRRPIRHEQQHRQRIESVAEVADEIDRRGIGPVYVLEAKHEAARSRQLDEKRAKLPLHLLGGA